MSRIALTAQHAELTIGSAAIGDCMDVLSGEVRGEMRLSEVAGAPGADSLTMPAHDSSPATLLSMSARPLRRCRPGLMAIELASMSSAAIRSHNDMRTAMY